MTFEEMSQVDLRTVDKSTLIRLDSVSVDPNASHEERKESFLHQIKNPYCYLDDEYVTKISYIETFKSIEDIIFHYIQSR